MNMKSAQKCEKTHMDKWLNFKLPNYAKKIGWGLFIVSLVSLLSTKLIDGDLTVAKVFLKKAMLLSLFIVVLSREKVEDERVQHIRAKAFGVTFLFSAVYILVQPIVNFVVGFILGEEQELFEDLGDFVILWFMLVVYLMFFYIAKRNN